MNTKMQECVNTGTLPPTKGGLPMYPPAHRVMHTRAHQGSDVQTLTQDTHICTPMCTFRAHMCTPPRAHAGHTCTHIEQNGTSS